jgi:S1-C subfamily serine protease
MLHTGLHDDYHRPTDDARRINAPGMRRAARLLFAITYDLATRDDLPCFREAAAEEAKPDARKHKESGPPMPVRLGVEWQAGDRAEKGVRLTRVAEGSPAERAGLQPGDRIIEIAGREVETGDDLSWIVASAQPSVSIKVRRVGHDEPLELSGRLDGEPLRLGLRWRRDEAEPGTLVVTHVVRGSPAAETGLRPGDRVYQIGGRDFDDEDHFARLARTLPAPLTLRIERDGRLHTVEIPVEGHSQKRAA